MCKTIWIIITQFFDYVKKKNNAWIKKNPAHWRGLSLLVLRFTPEARPERRGGHQTERESFLHGCLSRLP